MSIQYSVNYASNGVSQRISLIKHSFFLKKKPTNQPNQKQSREKLWQVLQIGSWLDYQETLIPFLVLLFTSDADFKLKTSPLFTSSAFSIVSLR